MQVYESSSGQQLNRNNTALFFSQNTPTHVQDAIKARFGAQVIKPHESYLGLPSLIGRSKKNTFAKMKHNLESKLAGWKEKLLSNARKEVLIKVAAQAVPSYTMSCFKLPNGLCEKMTGMVRQFWWGQVKNEKKVAWMSWERMCLPKDKGGIGFRDLKSFNLALLAKQGWRLQTNSSSLFAWVYKAKYFPNGDFVNTVVGKKASFAWRSIMAAQQLVKRGLRWQVGDGQSIRIWHDQWLPTRSTYRVVTPEKAGNQIKVARELLREENLEWNTELVKEIFLPQDTEAILSIPISESRARDRMV